MTIGGQGSMWSVVPAGLAILMLAVGSCGKQVQIADRTANIRHRRALTASHGRIWSRRAMVIGCERPGVVVDLVVQGQVGHPIESCERILLTDGTASVVPEQLDDLRGHVNIRDAAMALRYVRLLTSPETWFLWKGDQIEVEIVEPSEIPGIPNFGLKHEIPLTVWSQHGSGIMGVIDADAFTARGFSHPVVRSTPDGFDVERWLYVEERYNRCRIEHVCEHVSRDGAVTRTVLTATPPQSDRQCGFEIPKSA